jgi:predicted esterase
MSFFRANISEPFDGPHQDQAIARAGTNIAEANRAMIMIHGRGASAESIITLSEHFKHTEDMAFVAPQASGHTWYPFSFLAPPAQNQPGINSGLQAIHNLVNELNKEGIPNTHIYILGFSQGACLASEYVARHPDKYGGLFALSGGLIGDSINIDSYEGDLQNTPIFLGCSDVDPHIPKARVDESEAVLQSLNGDVTKKIYSGMGHLVNEDEINEINRILSATL